MENFDAIGRWRTTGEDGAPIDASGGLPSGADVRGRHGAEAGSAEPPGRIRGAPSREKLLTYALGRGIEYYDAPAVRAMLRDSQADDYRFATVVLNIVKSTPFQLRRSQ